jgi:hypothetical protein
MRNRTSLALIIPLLIVCFAAGVLSVIIKPPNPDTISVANTPFSPFPFFPTPTRASRFNIIIFGVDSFSSASSGTLLTTWLLTFGSKEETIELIGIPYDASLPDGRTLREAFSLFEPPDYGAQFIASMTAFTPYPIAGFIVLDRVGFAGLIDYLGGFTLGDQAYDGSRTLVALGLLENNPQESLKLQAQILQAMVLAAPALGRTPEVTPLTTMVPDHAFSSPAAAQIATMAIPLLPINPERVEIKIWTG